MRIFIYGLYILLLVCDLKADEFDYEHQAKWYDKYAQCSMNRQSPIELISNDAELFYDMPRISFEYYDTPYTLAAKCENNGHTANVQLPKSKAYLNELWPIFDKLSPHITGGPLPYGRFVAESVHFHWGSENKHGSEHVIDSERFSMEMHIVHRNSKYSNVEEARENEDGLAVLAVLYAVNLTQNEDFPGLERVLSGLEAIAEFNKTSDVANFTLSRLLDDLDLTEFFTYEGSLTTPPCSEAVTWVVFSHPISITPAQMQRFYRLADGHGSILENNYRSLQPKGNRKVYLRNKRRVMSSMIESPIFWELIRQLHPELYEPHDKNAFDNEKTVRNAIMNSKFVQK